MKLSESRNPFSMLNPASPTPISSQLHKYDIPYQPKFKEISCPRYKRAIEPKELEAKNTKMKLLANIYDQEMQISSQIKIKQSKYESSLNNNFTFNHHIDERLEKQIKHKMEIKTGEILQSQIDRTLNLSPMPSPRLNKFMSRPQLHEAMYRHMETMSPSKPSHLKIDLNDNSPTAGSPIKKNFYNPINGELSNLNSSYPEISTGRYKTLEKAGNNIIGTHFE